MKPHVVCLAGLLALLGTSCQQTVSTDKSGLFDGPINGVFENNPSIVLIIPTSEEDAGDQQRVSAYVRGIEKMVRERGISSDTDVITDAEALNRDLSSNSVMVYGTVRGNLWLAKHIDGIPVTIEPDRIIFDRQYEGTDLRFIAAWPNPQNPSRGMLIYTAQQAKDVVGINAVTHGLTDYVIARDEAILGSGRYIKWEGRWLIHPPLDVASEDIDFFFKTVEQVHPNHLANISGSDYKALRQRCRAALEAENQRKGRISKAFLALTVAEAAAAFGDGHTSLQIDSDLIESERSILMPPFTLKRQAGHVIIGNTTEGFEHIRGAHLLEINGLEIEEFLQPMLAKVSGEREAYRISRLLGKQQIYWALLQPVEQHDMEITIIRHKTEPETLNVDLIDLSEYRKVFKGNAKKRPNSTHRFYHGDHTCYWQYNQFMYSETGRKTIDAVFCDVRERGSENLIIDLRFNGGGNSYAGDYILNYITSKRYRMYWGSDVKISKQVYGKELWGLPARLLRGRILRFRDGLKRPHDMGFRFGGKVYALIGPATFSSASDLAAVLEDFDIATLVGEETGGLRECFGDCRRFTLPNSGLQFTVSHKRFFVPKPGSDDDKRGVVPDIVVNDELLAPYMDTDDPILAFTLDMIERQDKM